MSVDASDVMVDAVLAATASAWPDVRVGREVVRARLGSLGGVPADHLADLGLAWAGLAGDTRALHELDRVIQREAVRATTSLRRPAWFADEVHQELARRVLVVEPGTEPRLANFAGQSSLGRWLGVAAMRTALNLMRRDRGEVPLTDAEEDDAELPAAVGRALAPELAIVRDRYSREVEAAIRGAFTALDSPRDRNLLRLYYLEQVGLDRLGQMFGVHGSTVSRWLTTLRETIMDDTRARLGEQLGMAGHYGDVDSLIRAVRSELDLSLSRILKVST